MRAMSSGCQSRSSKRCDRWLLILAVSLLSLTTAEFAGAQIHGIPPSVTSIQYHRPPFLPNAAPSVTSLGPYGYGNGQFAPVYAPFPGRSGYGYGYGHGKGNKNRNGYYGGAWVVPYYIPVYDVPEGYEAAGDGGPYLYAAPPAEQTLHIVVDLPASKHELSQDDEDSSPPAMALSPNKTREAADAVATSIEPTVLVFRDGHQQEVTNYAIVGPTVYVFDKRTQKIAITDLDVAATVKLNDDRGVDFHVPSRTKS